MAIEKYHMQAEEFFTGQATLKPESCNILERLIKAVDEFFFQICELTDCSKETQAICMAIADSALVPKEKVFFTKLAGLRLLSFREKTLMVLGYFFPEPRYIRLKYGQGLKAFWMGWKNHWIRLIGKFFKFAAGILK